MGRKVHPLGFRLGIIRDWQSKWYDDKHYAEFIMDDVRLRKAIQSKYADAGISLIEIERQANKVAITVHTSRPGIVIGRGGQRVEEMRQYLESVLGGKKIQLDIREIRQPELDAYLVARSVAEQMERRVAYRRAMKQSIFRTLQAGAKGMRIICSGRLGGVEIARRQMMHQGRVPLHTLRADIDYGFTEAHTTLGRIGVKVWIYRGDILPAPEVVEEVVVEAPPPAPPPAETPAAPARDITMAEAVAGMGEVQPKEKAEEAPAAEVKKPRTRKKAETAAAEAAEPETETKAEAAEPAKKPRTRAKKTETVAETEAKAEAKPARTRTNRAKTESAKEKESEKKAKKEE